MNKRLVRKLARRQGTFSPNMDLRVLVDAGNEGLVRAAHFFKPSYGARFSSYAVPAVQRQIWRAAMKEADMVQIPITWKELQVKAYGARKVGWQLVSYLPYICWRGASSCLWPAAAGFLRHLSKSVGILLQATALGSAFLSGGHGNMLTSVLQPFAFS